MRAPQVWVFAGWLAILAAAGFPPFDRDSAAQPAPSGGIVADIPLPSGGSERGLFIAVPQPRAAVILLPGGDGVLTIDASSTMRPGGNFLVRTSRLWAAQGFAVLVLGTPNGSSLMGQRHLPAYGAALDRAVDYVRSRVNAPVWIIGTSQGSTGAANGAAHLGAKIAGVVLTSSVTRLGSAGETVFDSDPGAIAVPALVVANAGDTCMVSPPSDAPRILAALARSPRKELVTVQSGAIQSDPCQAASPHGYLGIEAQVVQRISDWIKSASGR